MLETVFRELGPWNWMVLGFVLLALEIVVPGFFLLWIGIAALVTGAVSLGLWELSFWTWHVQVLLFLTLSIVTVLVGRKLIRDGGDGSDEPLLNRRGQQLVGREATLTESIIDGRGRVKIGDTMWRVAGPNLPAGTKVRVVSATASDLELTVEEA